MKVVIIGASHSGLTAAKELKTLLPKAEVVLFDRQTSHELAYISSGVMMYYHGLVENLAELATPAEPLTELGVRLELETTINKIEPEQQCIYYQVKDSEEVLIEKYDKLIVATGSNAYQNEQVQEAVNVVSFKTLTESKQVLEKIERAQKIAIVGSGYISVELIDALKNSGKELTLIHSQPHMLARYFDRGMIQPVEESLQAAGIKYYPEEYFVDFNYEADQVTSIQLENTTVTVDLVIMARTTKPNTNILSGLVAQNEDQTVKVNPYLKTSDDHIYAVGDIVPLHYDKTNRDLFMPLVGRAVRMGRAVALNLAGITVPYPVTQKITASEVFGTFIGSCGVTSDEAPFLGLKVMSFQTTVTVNPQLIVQEPEEKALIRVIYLVDTLELVGFQICATKRRITELDLVATLINAKVTLPELAVEEFCFMPRFTKTFHPLNQVAQAALAQRLASFEQ